MAVNHKQTPKGVRLKWAPLKEARSVSFSRDSVQGTWVLKLSEGNCPVKPSSGVKYSGKGQSDKKYLIP
ncbi:hypothetical protein DHW03_02330 [Pedobacter yonginense]|uniref:Uncharacterized protein n=1 Tax=Pedobacter yonginense TaxID=651869 RepID=A0A317EPW2_9SPHI|nr:hypothetical protein [Pedobacter yonginense]PWS28704.1 hypothetical protein DHW03_02330 [Pedobacter yonginense]